MNDIHEKCRTGVRNLTLAGAGFILILCMISIIGNNALHKQNQSLQRDLDYYSTNYLHKIGGTSLWNHQTINYHLRSFDGGKTWYASHTTNDEVIIDGPDGTVYPGLMKTLQDWDNILSYVEKHGPMNLNNPSDLKTLESNGFTVKRITN